MHKPFNLFDRLLDSLLEIGLRYYLNIIINLMLKHLIYLTVKLEISPKTNPNWIKNVLASQNYLLTRTRHHDLYLFKIFPASKRNFLKVKLFMIQVEIRYVSAVFKSSLRYSKTRWKRSRTQLWRFHKQGALRAFTVE